MNALLLAAAFFAAAEIKVPPPKPVYSRDLVSVYAGKQVAMFLEPQTVPGSPFGAGSGGGGVTFPLSTLATFGTADGAANSVAFNSTAGCVMFEGTAADTNEFLVCGGALDADTTWTLSRASGVASLASTVPITFNNSVADMMWSGTALTLNGVMTVNGNASTGTLASFNDRFILHENLAQTVASGTLRLSAANRMFLVIEDGDQAFDFAHAAATDPTLFVHSHNQSTTQWLSLAHDGTNGQLSVGTGGISVPAGAEVTPGLNFLGATGSGFWFSGGNLLTSISGVRAFNIVSTGPQAISYGLTTGLAAANTATLSYNLTQTPDQVMLTTGTAGNSVVIAEEADKAFDFQNCSAGTSAATDPDFCVHSHNQSTTEWISLRHNATNGVLDVGTGFVSIPDGALFPLDANIQLGTTTDNTSTYIRNGTVQAPDTAIVYVGSTSNSLHIGEVDDSGNNLGNGIGGSSAAVQPALIIHGSANNTFEFNQVNMMGSHGGNATTLVDNTATAFFHTPTLSANGHAYVGDGSYSIYLTDAGGEVQVVSGNFYFTAIRANTGGTVCSIQHVGNDGVLVGLPLKQLSSGTLDVATNGLACSVTSNVATFTMQANTSLTPTTFTMTSQVNLRRGNAEIIVD